MLSRDEVVGWLDAFDTRKYPPHVYEELVVHGRLCPDRLLILGAWKTGCIRVDPDGSDYQDQTGVTYSFTKRWSPSTPVGYSSWVHLSQMEMELRTRIPQRFPGQKPAVMSEVESMLGIGFVRAIFLLHCFYPETYPLFDQHVYRAYRHVVSSGEDITVLASNQWTRYGEYRDFFRAQVQGLDLPYWHVDRALWAMGRELKERVRILAAGRRQTEAPSVKGRVADHTDISELHAEEWVHSRTLGGKRKRFWWRIDSACNIYIGRVFKGNKWRERKIEARDLDLLNDWMSRHNWVPLANNVQKLRLSTEVEGVGWFLCHQLCWRTPAEWQLASHLGVIFTLSGVWAYNGRKRGICFRRQARKWRDMIARYYMEAMEDDA